MTRVGLRVGILLLLGVFMGFALADRDFQQEFNNTTTGFRGDFNIIGNALVTCDGCNPNQGGQHNGNRDMKYIDVDSDASTANSSSAELNLPAGATVEYAALVWGGRTTNNNGGTTIKFKTPDDASYQVITSDWTSYISGYNNGNPYASYKEVTSELQALANPSGTYWAAGLDTVVGHSDGLGFYGGWALIVVYRNSNELSVRRITIDAGLKKLTSGSIDLTVSGLVTPVTGSYVMHLGVITWEGDDGITGDTLQAGPDTNNLTTLSNAVNPSNNFYNSSISHYGTYFHDKNPDYNNQFAVDADLVEFGGLPNDISQVVARFSTNGDWLFPQVMVTSVELAIISGRVFEDINGDSNLNDAQRVPGVTVKLYRDDGDGIPNAADTYVGTTTTSSQGKYSFQGISDGAYWVVVDSKTVAPTNGFNQGAGEGDVWAEQTYGAGGDWGGALCDDDANSNTAASARTSDGACFGGRRGDVSDDAANLGGAEHVAKVVVSSQIVTQVDFGFSFNVVTNTNDQDDDANNGRTAQGSLRQFIQNANAISGDNAMRFVPAVPTNASGNGGDWWSVAVADLDGDGDADPLPTITDGGTVIDGAAYAFSDGNTIRNSNSGTATSSCSTVGVDQVPFTAINLPELEVKGTYTMDWVFKVDTSGANVAIRNLAAYGSGGQSRTDPAQDDNTYDPDPTGDVFVVQAGSGLSIDHDIIGLRASATDPGQGSRTRSNGVNLFSTDNAIAAGWSISHNLVSYSGHQAVFVRGANVGAGTIQQNEVSHANWLGRWNADGISSESGAGSNGIIENCVIDNNGPGLDSWQSGGHNTWRNNTILRNGRNIDNNAYFNGTDNIERYGVRIMNVGNTFEKNIVASNHSDGVVVTQNHDPSDQFYSTQNLISQNSFYDNGALAIDLDQTHGNDDNDNPRGDGVTPNDGQTSSSQQNIGLDYPIFTKAVLGGGQLTVEGYIGTSADKLQPAGGATWIIEIYLADDTPANQNGPVEINDGMSVPHGEGRTYLISVPLQSGDFTNGEFSKTVAVNGLQAGDEITAITIDDQNNTSEFNNNVRVRPPGIPVSGSLYHDLAPNGLRDDGDPALTEADIDQNNPPSLYVKIFQDADGDCSNGFDTPATAATEIQSDGSYNFDAIEAGNYCLVLDDSNDLNDTQPYDPNPGGWLYVNPPAGVLPLVISDAQVNAQTPSANNDFGLFHGSLVEGTVFRDVGDGSGTANDALQNGDEPGVPNVVVSVSDGGHTRTATTDASGHYLLYVPADWSNVVLSHGLRPASGYNTGGSGPHQASSWADASGAASSAARITLGSAADISGQTLAGRNFGVVYKSSFRPDQSGSVTSPGTITYVHTYEPGTQGTVTFSRTSGDYTYQLHLDANCDGDFDDAGEAWQTVSASARPSFVVDDAWPRNPDGSFAACGVEVRALVPDGEPEGAVDVAQISATLAWANNSPVEDPTSLTDTTTVRTRSALQLEKVVRNVTQNSGFDTSAGGQPGDILEYCIRYRNAGIEDVAQVVISDPVPFFVDVALGVYNGNDILWRDAGGTVHELTAAADGDEGQLDSGVIVVHAENTLQPGAGGEVCYQVRLR